MKKGDIGQISTKFTRLIGTASAMVRAQNFNNLKIFSGCNGSTSPLLEIKEFDLFI